MVTKTTAGDPMKEVRAAWKHAHTAWKHVESSLSELADAEAALVRSLRVAGAVWSGKARTEANTTLKQLDKKRKTVMRQFEKLAQRYDLVGKPARKTTATRRKAGNGAGTSAGTTAT